MQIAHVVIFPLLFCGVANAFCIHLYSWKSEGWCIIEQDQHFYLLFVTVLEVALISTLMQPMWEQKTLNVVSSLYLTFELTAALSSIQAK